MRAVRYLQEVGYTDTILDVRSQRVRSLLGLSNSEPNGSVETKNLEQILNGGESPKQKGQEIKRPSGDVLETFNFLENADDSDEEEENDMIEGIPEGKDKHRMNKHKIGNEGLAADLTDDPDTEEALKEFDFLVTAEDGEGAGEARSSGDGTEWDKDDLSPTTEVWDVDQGLISKLKEQYKKERKGKKGVKRVNRTKLYDMIADLGDDELPHIPSGIINQSRSASLDVEPIYTFRAHIGPVLSLAISSNGEQCFSGGIDATIQWWNMPSPNVDPYDTYEPNVLAGTLVAHTDAVWGLAYSGIKNQLLSCSADGTVRLWNPQEKLPCICTYNGNKGKMIHSMVAHLDAVTSLAVDPNGIYLMSGSHDCSIRLWNLDSKTCVQEITAHRKKLDESIYDVAFHPSKAYIASAGADALAKVFV
ncbi:striatin-3 [Camelus ferus]|nr:striatin-3 [Camelus ferus]